MFLKMYATTMNIDSFTFLMISQASSYAIQFWLCPDFKQLICNKLKMSWPSRGKHNRAFCDCMKVNAGHGKVLQCCLAVSAKFKESIEVLLAYFSLFNPGFLKMCTSGR